MPSIRGSDNGGTAGDPVSARSSAVLTWLAAAFGQLGRTDEAKAALDKAVAIGAASFDMYVRNRAPFWRPDDYAHMLEGLRKAGWEG